MDGFIIELVEQVVSAGGSLSYKTMYENTSYENRRMLPNALKQARANGLLTQTVALVDGVIVHTYHVVTPSV